MDNLETITLFVQDLNRSKRFYSEVFDGAEVYEDEVSWVIDLNGVLVNLLQASEAAELIEPMTVPRNLEACTFLLTTRVASVDVVCEVLKGRGVPLLNGPMDRPWGRRTAAFADPDGNVWEVAQLIE